ncbi:MAG: radical SAM protein [Myxococcales bacterium]|nr:radical SAM protein [Myxococcales bacterium]
MRQYIEKLGYKPRTCVWELTLACNAACRHCGSHAGRPREDELTTAEALGVADQLAALGCEHVTLSGGEPLLRRDWPELAARLAGHGVQVGVISNGLAFDAEAARRAVEAGVAAVTFSVDGLAAVHDRMRGRPGAYARAVAAFEIAAAAGLPTCAATHVHRHNLDQLDELHQRLGALGVRSWKLQLCNPAGEAARHREMILEPRDLLRLVPKMVELKQRGLPYVETSDSIGYFGPYEQALRGSWRQDLGFWTGCYAGCRVIGIESAGNVKGCLALPSARHGTDEFVEGNVRAAALADLWFRPGGFAYNRCFDPARLTGFCRTCPYAAICRAGCHWTALAHGGTLYENRFCYYRVSVEETRARRGPRRWFVEGLAPAAIVATLGLSGCYESYHPWYEGPDAGSDTAAAADTVEPPPDVVPDATSEGIFFYGPVPPDAVADAAGWYGPPPVDAGPADTVHCPTYEEACCDCDYMGPSPIPPGCPDPCAVNDYGVPIPMYGVPDDAGIGPDGAGDAPAEATDCPDPCGPTNLYGPLPTYPPGCRYDCDSDETCPTAAEACCDCEYMGPAPIPERCADPCASGKRR